MKRHTSSLRSIAEIKANNVNTYDAIVKRPGNINPIFTGKPYESVRKENYAERD